MNNKLGHIRTRMKKWSIIIAAALVATWLMVDTVREFFANETIHYFSSEPHRLVHVAALAIAGGFAALGFTRLSPRTQQHVRVFVWGAAASTLTMIAGYFGFCFFSLSSSIAESGSTVWILFVPLIFSGIAAFCWFEFYRALETRVPDDHVA